MRATPNDTIPAGKKVPTPLIGLSQASLRNSNLEPIDHAECGILQTVWFKKL